MWGFLASPRLELTERLFGSTGQRNILIEYFSWGMKGQRLSRPKGQPPYFSQDSDDLSSRARVTVPGFRTARSVASRR